MRDYTNYYPSYRQVTKHSGNKMFLIQRSQEGVDVLIQDTENHIDKEAVAIINHHANPFNEWQDEMEIMLHNDDYIHRGNFIKELYSDKRYLIISKVKDNVVYQYAKVIECNNVVTFVDKSSKIHTIPCYITDKTSVYSDALDKSIDITSPNDQVMIYAPRNRHTIGFNLGQRFVFNNRWVYSLTKFDEISQDGVVLMKMRTESYNSETDDLANNISKYHEYHSSKDETVAVEGVKYDLSVTGVDFVRYGKSREQKVVILNNGKSVSKLFSATIDNTTLATIESIEGNVISVKGNTEGLYGVAVLRVELEDCPENIDNVIYKDILVKGAL